MVSPHFFHPPDGIFFDTIYIFVLVQFGPAFSKRGRNVASASPPLRVVVAPAAPP